MDNNLTPPHDNPPPIAPPPLIATPSQGPVRRRGYGWPIVALVLAGLLVLSLFGNLQQFARGLMSGRARLTRFGGPRLEEVILRDHRADTKIVVINLDGIIMSDLDGSGYGLVESIAAQLKRAGKDDEVRAVILKVNSPGGEVLAADEIYRAIAEFQKNCRKPIIASMGSLAASGGYYVSAPCQWIVANELTLTGSIGVIMHAWNYRGLMDKVGIRPTVYKSGRFKDMLSGERNTEDIPPEENQMMQALIDETFSRFKEIVGEGRALAYKNNKKVRPLSANWQEYADGRVLNGRQAYELGFVDELGNFETAVARAEKLAGVSDANLIEYQRPFDLANVFRFLGKTETPAIKVDLGLEAPRLQAGRLYFLSPTVLQ